jgi:DNA-binding transcriptional LysR family regulator
LLKESALDLGLCAMPVTDPAVEIVPLFSDDLLAILPRKLKGIPKTVTPAFMSSIPLILGNPQSALCRTVTEWLALAGNVPKPVMEFDNVEAIKSVVAVGLGRFIVPALSLGKGHIAMTNTTVRPIKPRLARQIALVKLRGKRSTEAVSLTSAALLSLRRSR